MNEVLEKNILSGGYKEINIGETLISNAEKCTKESIQELLNSHNNNNIFTCIWMYIDELLRNIENINLSNVLDKLKKDLKENKELDFSNLIGLIIMNNPEIREDKKYIQLLKSIDQLNKNIRQKQLKIKKVELRFHQFKNEIISNIKATKPNHIITITDRIINGYFLNFNFSSHLGEYLNIPYILIELITDLVDNSIKYSNVGTKIDININQNENGIKVSISDEGFGIKKEKIEKIFEPGVRLDNKGNELGNGLGGARLINEINELGGKLYIKSEEGKGTEILFTIPTKK